MGMAASQARWISLAARKTNVEYEGQQINQARVALSNQSSELWNQLYKMQVPSAPSTTDFTKTEYTFEDSGTKMSISDIQPADYTDIDGIHYNSYVTYYANVQEYTGVRNTIVNPQVQFLEDEEGKPYYLVGTKKATSLAEINPTEKKELWGTYSAMLNQISENWPDTQLAKDWQAKNYANIFLWTDANSHVNFAPASGTGGDTLNDCVASQDVALHSYYAADQTVKKEYSKYAVVEYDPDNRDRAVAMKLEGSSYVYNLKATSVTDENAYNDAMNKYNYEKQVYEKNVQDINARTEQIQTEDRTLELRLKQLDTEQNALQTEMETIKKIISKNIENTFKTFDS